MDRKTAKPLAMAGGPLVAIGSSFVAVGLSGQPAFGYIGAGLLIPGVVLVVVAFWSGRRQER